MIIKRERYWPLLINRASRVGYSELVRHSVKLRSNPIRPLNKLFNNDKFVRLGNSSYPDGVECAVRRSIRSTDSWALPIGSIHPFHTRIDPSIKM